MVFTAPHGAACMSRSFYRNVSRDWGISMRQSRAFDQELHATLDELGTDLGCKAA